MMLASNRLEKRRIQLVRWAGAAVFVVGVHVGCAAYALMSWTEDEAENSAASPVFVEMATAPAPPPVELARRRARATHRGGHADAAGRQGDQGGDREGNADGRAFAGSRARGRAAQAATGDGQGAGRGEAARGQAATAQRGSGCGGTADDGAPQKSTPRSSRQHPLPLQAPRPRPRGLRHGGRRHSFPISTASSAIPTPRARAAARAMSGSRSRSIGRASSSPRAFCAAPAPPPWTTKPSRSCSAPALCRLRRRSCTMPRSTSPCRSNFASSEPPTPLRSASPSRPSLRRAAIAGLPAQPATAARAGCRRYRRAPSAPRG